MTGCECDQFERRCGPLDQRVHDGNLRRINPLPKNLVVLKTREGEFDHHAEVFHPRGAQFREWVSQFTTLANDGLPGIVWKTDRRLLVAWGVAKIYFRVRRIRERCWRRDVKELRVDAWCWRGGSSAGCNERSEERR